MKLRRTVSKRIDHDDEGLNVRAAFDAVVAVNVNERTDRAPEEEREPERPTEDEEAPDE